MSKATSASNSVQRKPAKKKMRRAILVLGMHRSGTSAATRCLNLLGIDIGNKLLPAAKDNPYGFWEHEDVVKINDALLGSLRRDWADTRALPDDWLRSAAAHRAHDELVDLISRDFGAVELWAVKDPRLCRLIPLWRSVLSELGIEASALLIVRHPAEVAMSLEARSGQTADNTHLAWLEHFAEAELATRTMPRSMIVYEDLLADWKRTYTKVANDLRLVWPRSVQTAQPEIEAFLRSGERHHIADNEVAALPELLGRLYGMCRAYEAGEQGWRPIMELVDDFSLMAQPFLRRTERLVEQVSESANRTQRLRQTMDGLLKGLEHTVTQARAVTSQTPRPADSAVLYFRSQNDGFTGQRACTQQHGWTEGNATFRFELPANAEVSHIRFDPSHHAGAFCVSEMRLSGMAVADLHTCLRDAHQEVISRTGGDGIWFASFDDDPQVEFDLQGLVSALSSPLIVELDCEQRNVESVAGALLAQQLTSTRVEFRQRMDTLQTEGARIEAERTAGVQREAQLQQRVEAVQAESAASVQREAQLQQRMEALHAESARIKAERAASVEREARALREAFWLSAKSVELREQLDAMSGQFAELGRRHDTVNTQLAELGRRRDALESREQSLQASNATLQNELAEIKTSTLWRVLVRVRAVLLMMPIPVRSILRRIGKTAWWLVTPWRVPARIRFLKQRRLVQNENAGLAVSEAVQPSLQPDNDTGAPPGESSATPPVYTYRSPEPDPAIFSRALLGLARPTLFSVVVPVYDTDPDLLRQTIESVQTQWYPHWELILVDDHSPSTAVGEVLGALTDPRIHVVTLTENKRISGATNEGMQRACGDYIVFLDHDDELTPDCLYELALCIDRDDPDYLYSDEDKLDTDGSFRDPFFKPDWSPDTMMSTMFTCHVSCVRRSLAQEVGGLRSEYDGGQDWDFVLRVTERTQRISHIPKVLYHWRITPASCASDLEAKPYAIDASKRAREDALRRRGLSGELLPVPELPGYYRTRYHLKGQPLFSIIIPSKNNGAVLRTCIDSIFDQTHYRRFEVLVINNGSTDAPTLEYLESLRAREQVTVLDHDVPFNYSEINNFGVAHARGGMLVFLNDDTEVLTADWLDYMGGYAQLSHVGAVGAKLLYPGSRRIQHGGVINLRCGPSHAFLNIEATAPGYFNRNLLEYDWIAVTGACLIVERSKFDTVGGFDEGLAVAYNDIDLCFRLFERGLFQVVCAGCKLIHHESLSRGNDTLDAAKMARLGTEREALFRKHPTLFDHDPFHNPNLAPNDVHFNIRS